jgi:hypothetical protein
VSLIIKASGIIEIPEPLKFCQTGHSVTFLKIFNAFPDSDPNPSGNSLGFLASCERFRPDGKTGPVHAALGGIHDRADDVPMFTVNEVFNMVGRQFGPCRVLQTPTPQEKEENKEMETAGPSPYGREKRKQADSTQDPEKAWDRGHIETGDDAAHIGQQNRNNGPDKNPKGFFSSHKQGSNFFKKPVALVRLAGRMD